jgi:hypothetical protein
VGTHAFVFKTVVAITPGSEYKRLNRISANNRVSPGRRDHNTIFGTRINNDASAWIVLRPLLHIDQRPAVPYLKYLRRRPSTKAGDAVNVALTAHRFRAELSARINDHAEQEMALLKLVTMPRAANIHRDSVDRIWPAARRIQKTRPDGIEPAQLRFGSEHIFAKRKLERVEADVNIET